MQHFDFAVIECHEKVVGHTPVKFPSEPCHQISSVTKIETHEWPASTSLLNIDVAVLDGKQYSRMSSGKQMIR